jgi:hypothetical protein
MNKQVIIFSVVAIILAAVNIIPFHAQTTSNCSSDSASVTRLGLPMTYLKTTHDSCEAAANKEFLFQALIVDVVVAGAILIGTNFLLNPRTRSERT